MYLNARESGKMKRRASESQHVGFWTLPVYPYVISNIVYINLTIRAYKQTQHIYISVDRAINKYIDTQNTFYRTSACNHRKRREASVTLRYRNGGNMQAFIYDVLCLMEAQQHGSNYNSIQIVCQHSKALDITNPAKIF